MHWSAFNGLTPESLAPVAVGNCSTIRRPPYAVAKIGQGRDFEYFCWWATFDGNDGKLGFPRARRAQQSITRPPTPTPSPLGVRLSKARRFDGAISILRVGTLSFAAGET